MTISTTRLISLEKKHVDPRFKFGIEINIQFLGFHTCTVTVLQYISKLTSTKQKKCWMMYSM